MLTIPSSRPCRRSAACLIEDDVTLIIVDWLGTRVYDRSSMRAHVLLLTLLISTTLSAQSNLEITEVLPSDGPATGGTRVTVRGDGFADGCLATCIPPQPPILMFGGVRALDVRVIDRTRIELITPPHLPGLVNVEISQGIGADVKRNAFTYSGDATAVLEQVLLPIYSPPVRGAFGSDFRTELRVYNRGSRRVALAGIPRACPLCPPPNLLNSTLEIPAGTEAVPISSGNPGAFIYVPRESSGEVALNLRVFDASRSETNFGTEIPVARESDFRRTIALLGVPLDDRFRRALRIYSREPLRVLVSFTGDESVAAGGPEQFNPLAGRTVTLQPGRNLFEPAYAVVTDFPEIDGATTRVTITASAPVWAFVTVTNNETQQITTISPQ